MSNKSYVEKLKDPRWQRRRLEILNIAAFTCQGCFSREKTLHVHHRAYRKGAYPWDYGDHELVVLCEDCHEVHSTLDDQLKAKLGRLSIHAKKLALGYISAEALIESVVQGAASVNDRLSAQEEIINAGATDFIAGSRHQLSKLLWDSDAATKGISFTEMNRFHYALWRLRLPEKWRESTQGWPE